MIFNSIEFCYFLPIVFILYWVLNSRGLKYQNIFLLAASYFFYGYWDWRFLGLIVLSTIIDYLLGLKLKSTKEGNRRKIIVALSVVMNLGLLGFFKYYNFFIDSFNDSFIFFGSNFQIDTLDIVLPVGISFYTFQTLSYTIDIYKNKLEPAENFIVFASFVSFFPQLVAGPIERATNLLPQFYKKHIFSYSQSADGMRQVLWGLFKKMVIADNCAEYVNDIFSNSEIYSSGTLVTGSVLFAIQIYCDFSGYSDIAIGTSRLFGFNLKRNFSFPYFSRDIAEFWRKWHMSLSTWFRDYLYIPLGGSKGGLKSKIRNTLVIFVVSGLWHGSNWTFVIWGLLNGLYFLPLLLTKKNRVNLGGVAENRFLPTLRELFSMGFTFGIVCFSWIFFRANNLSEATLYIEGFLRFDGISLISFIISHNINIVILCFFIAIMFVTEWVNRKNEYGIEKLTKSRLVNWSFFLFLYSSCLIFGGSESDFIYFQF